MLDDPTTMKDAPMIRCGKGSEGFSPTFAVYGVWGVGPVWVFGLGALLEKMTFAIVNFPFRCYDWRTYRGDPVIISGHLDLTCWLTQLP